MVYHDEPSDNDKSMGEILARKLMELKEDDFKEVLSLVINPSSKAIRNGKQLEIPITIDTWNTQNQDISITTNALIDSGTTTTLIHKDWVAKNNIQTTKLDKPIRLTNVDKSLNIITDYADINIIVSDIRRKDLQHVYNCKAYIGNIGDDEVILGLEWLQLTNPTIDWTTGWVSIIEDTPGFGKSFQLYTVRGKYKPLSTEYIRTTYH